MRKPYENSITSPIAGEKGTEIVPELAPQAGELVPDKPGKGAFCRTNLEEILFERKLQQLVLAGVTTEVCVQTTMLEANDRGLTVCSRRMRRKVTFRASKRQPLR